MRAVSVMALHVVYRRLVAYEPDVGQLVMAAYAALAQSLTNDERKRLPRQCTTAKAGVSG